MLNSIRPQLRKFGSISTPNPYTTYRTSIQYLHILYISVTYTNWVSSSAQNFYNSRTVCGTIEYIRNDFKWSKGSCSIPLPFVCEIGKFGLLQAPCYFNKIVRVLKNTSNIHLFAMTSNDPKGPAVYRCPLYAKSVSDVLTVYIIGV